MGRSVGTHSGRDTSFIQGVSFVRASRVGEDSAVGMENQKLDGGEGRMNQCCRKKN